MGAEVTALLGLLGLGSAFALVGIVLACWMAWRIVEKAGLPGWTGLGAVLLTLTAVGTIVPVILLWVFAFIRWPRDTQPAGLAPLGYGAGPASPGPAASAPASPPALPPPAKALPDKRGWRLTGSLGGTTVSLVFDGSSSSWQLTGGPVEQAHDLSVPHPSVGKPHARLMVAGNRIGLLDLGSPGGTFIDGARLLPEHGPRDISAAHAIRLGSIDLALSRS